MRSLWQMMLFGSLLWLASAPVLAADDPRPDPAGPGYSGQRGLLRLWTALPYRSSSVVLNATTEYSQASDFLLAGDSNRRMAGRFSLAWVPFTGFEVVGGFSLSVNDNDAFEPVNTQSVGDPYLGLRYGIDLADGFSLGLGLQSTIPTGNGAMEVSADGISNRILAAFEYRPLDALLIALNAGYHFDNTRFVFDSTINDAQMFSAGVNPHDQLILVLGGAYQIGPVAPFLEFGMQPAMGADDLAFGDNPGWLTIGLRGWPLSTHSLHLLAAVEIGLTGVDAPAGKAHQAPFNLVAGMGYDWGYQADTGEAKIREVVREKIVEVPASTEPSRQPGRIAGQVLDARTGQPLGDAHVRLADSVESVLVTEKTAGRFTSCPVDAGARKIVVTREGYRQTEKVVLVTDQPETPVKVEMQPATGPTYGTLKGTVRRVRGGSLAALISIPTRKIRTRASRKNGSFDLRMVSGTFDVLISMPHYVTQRQKVKLEPGDVVILNVELYPKK